MADETNATKQAKTRVSDFDFVKACLTAGSADGASKITGLTVESVASRARKLRKAGVKIPEFPRQRQGIDVDGLNNIISGKDPR